MTHTEAFIADFTFELAKTREVLARLPESHWNWAPHEKSWPTARLAGHVGGFPQWAIMTIETSELDLMPDGKQMEPEPVPATAAENLAKFDEGAKAALLLTATLTDEKLGETWRLLAAGKQIMAMPKLSVLRGFVLHHMIHHRAQLTMYLRLCGIAVPALYGPSADEGQDMFA